LELFFNSQQYNQTGVSWPTGSWLKHSDWLRWRLMGQSQKILLGHAIFVANTVTIILHVRLAIKHKLGLWWPEISVVVIVYTAHC